MAFEFKLPDIGEGIHEGEIVQWLVAVGDVVTEDQPLVEIMTDKVTAEIPSPVSGTITALNGKAGEVIRVGAVIVVLEEGAGNATAGKSAKPATAKNVEASASAAVPTQVPSKSTEREKVKEVDGVPNGNGKSATVTLPSSAKVLAAPATRKLARQMGVDLTRVSGSGPRGRITAEDVKTGGGSGGGSAPRRATRAARKDQRKPFAGMRKKIAEHLVKSKQTVPHFAYVEEVDMSRIMSMREDLLPLAEERGVKLSFLPFIVKAVIAAFDQYPMLNATLDEAANEIVWKGEINMGIAVATDQGLVVPVIKNADQKSLFELAGEISQLAEKARNNKLTLDDMRGGTFTLTSIGSIGGIFGIPIINHPEVAIMGVNKIETRPVVRNIGGADQIVIRDMMYLSLAGDHRVMDGAEVALFVKEVIRNLEAPTGLILRDSV